MNSIPEHFLKKIQEAKEERLKELDLSCDWNTPDDQKLTYIPAEVFELEQLEVLNLRNNRLTAIPDAIGQLSHLTDLSLSDNRLTVVPNALGQLDNLTLLNLNSNRLISFPNTVAQLRNLTYLDLSDNQLAEVPEAITQLHNLAWLDLSRNQITVVPNAITQLQNLKSLDFGDNQLIAISSTIAQLSNLKLLNLSGNLITTIPDAISKLQNLTSLSLSNIQSTSIPYIVYKLFPLRKLVSLTINGNSVIIPPPEIVIKGPDSIKSYFHQIQANGDCIYLYEAKLLVIGEREAGKTTLAKKIENPHYQLRKYDASREGIDVIQWHFLHNEQLFRVNIWDFSGQEIYYGTHQFFFTKRSLYALVADTCNDNTDFYYWLNEVELLSDKSPLVIIKNEKQDRHRETDELSLRGQFTNLKRTLVTNLATNRGLPDILQEIKHSVYQLPHIGTTLPKTWGEVRKVLENDGRNHISFDEYLNICQKNGLTELKDSLQLSGYLHDLGVCLHFQEDPLLKKTVILKHKWGTDAVYKVLDNKTVIRNLGRFTRPDLANIWDAPEYVNMQDELLQLMINFKLCYKIPSSRDTYIAPQLLTENQPECEWEETNNLILRYTYEFMPKGILTQFIVAMHPCIAEKKYVWKSGVILEKDQAQAEVIEYYGKREIKIRISGKHKKELMTIVTYELDQIHASYRRLKYSKLIPCNCSTCKDSQEPHFYPYAELREFISNGQHEIQCRKKPYKMVDVLGLIDDVIDRKQLVKEEERKLGGSVVFQAPVTQVVVQHSRNGDYEMVKNFENVTIKSAWANGLFYLFAFVVVITGLGVLAKNVSLYTLPIILVAGMLFVPVIGALQLRQDNRLSEKPFVELMRMVIGQLPLIGKLARQDKEKKKTI